MDDITVTQVDEVTIQVVKVSSVEPVIQEYNYDFLLNQKIAIQQQLDEFTAARQAEIAEVDSLLALFIKPEGTVDETAIPAEVIPDGDSV